MTENTPAGILTTHRIPREDLVLSESSLTLHVGLVEDLGTRDRRKEINKRISLA
jgi:hypothetical protein